MKTKRKIWLLIFIIALSAMASVGNNLFPMRFKADIFQYQEHNSAPSDGEIEVFIPDTFNAFPGQSGQIFLGVNKDFLDIVGFAFSISWNSEYLEFLKPGSGVEGTVLAEKGFYTEINSQVSGKINVIAASGGEGIDLKKGNNFFNIAFKVKDNVALQTEVPLKIDNISFVNGQSLTEIKVSKVQNGKINIKNEGIFRVVDINNLSSSSLEIVFSDYVKEGFAKSDFTFYQENNNSYIEANNIIQDDTIISSENGKKIIFTNLASQNVNAKYFIKLSNNITGHSEGKLSEGFNFAFFTGFDDQSAEIDNSFTIQSLEVKSKTEIVINFTQEVGSGAEDPRNFEIFDDQKNNLTVSEVIKNGSALTLKTATQTADKLYFLIVNPEKINNNVNQKIGPKNVQGFFGYLEQDLAVNQVEPAEVIMGFGGNINLKGNNFSASCEAFLNNKKVNFNFLTENTAYISGLGNFTDGSYNLMLKKAGQTMELKNALIISKVKSNLEILEQNVSDIPKVSNQNGSVRIWIAVKDPLGNDNIDKVTADLSEFASRDAAALLTPAENDEVGGARLFFRDVIVPVTIPTSTTPKEIKLTAVNKNNITSSGIFKIMVTKDLIGGIPPEIVKAYANPEIVSSNSDEKLSFHVVVRDSDGADNIAKVILDLGKIGLGIKKMQTPDDAYSSVENLRDCTESDYIKGQWNESSCTTTGKRTRSINLKSGVECRENSTTKPLTEEACVNTTSFLNDWLNIARANSQIGEGVGNTAWYEVSNLQLPDSVDEGVYELPLTVIDKDNEEATSVIKITVQENDQSDRPHIDKDDIHGSPHKSGTYNDCEETFRLHVKATDPNGAEDLPENAVIANLMEMGMGTVALKKDYVEGKGAWFSSEELNACDVTPGYRRISFTVTDSKGNFYTQKNFEFKVEDKAEKESIDNKKKNAFSINMEKSFITGVPVNDEKTKITFYVLIEKTYAETVVNSVRLNLGNIAEYRPDNYTTPNNVNNTTNNLINYDLKKGFFNKAFAVDNAIIPTDDAPVEDTADQNPLDDDLYESSSNRIVEMKTVKSHSSNIKEEWFMLGDIVILKSTKADANNAHLIKITATAGDNVQEADFSLLVSDSVLPQVNQNLPFLQNAVAVEKRSVEILFSQAIEADKITKDVFRIVESEDRSQIFAIHSLKVHENGQIVTINLKNSLDEDTYYTIIANSSKIGLAADKVNNNKIEFKGFQKKKLAGSPDITRVKAKSINEVEVTFSQPIKYSTIKSDGSNFEIFETGGGANFLEIKQVKFTSDNQKITLSTANQKPAVKYHLKVTEITNALGQIFVTSERSATFSGFQSEDRKRSIFKRMDINDDGEIGFPEFSLLSSFYGQALQDNGKIFDNNDNNEIDFDDFTWFSSKFGKKVEDLIKEENDNNEDSSDDEEDNDHAAGDDDINGGDAPAPFDIDGFVLR